MRYVRAMAATIVSMVAAMVVSTVFASRVVAQTAGGAGIVYGRDHAFAIQAPRGWTLDNVSGKAQGLHAVFYRNGESWQKAGTVMYANTASKRVAGQRTLEELMEFDLARFLEGAPKLRVTAPTELAAGTSKALIRRFEGDQHGNYEAVAYIDEKLTIVMLVLTSRTQKGFDEAYADFETLVKSYRFLSDEARSRK